MRPWNLELTTTAKIAGRTRAVLARALVVHWPDGWDASVREVLARGMDVTGEISSTELEDIRSEARGVALCAGLAALPVPTVH